MRCCDRRNDNKELLSGESIAIRPREFAFFHLDRYGVDNPWQTRGAARGTALCLRRQMGRLRLDRRVWSTTSMPSSTWAWISSTRLDSGGRPRISPGAPCTADSISCCTAGPARYRCLTTAARERRLNFLLLFWRRACRLPAWDGVAFKSARPFRLPVSASSW